MSEEKGEYIIRPGEPYLEELDPELHNANQAAHDVAWALDNYYSNQTLYTRTQLSEAWWRWKQLVSGEGE